MPPGVKRRQLDSARFQFSRFFQFSHSPPESFRMWRAGARDSRAAIGMTGRGQSPRSVFHSHLAYPVPHRIDSMTATHCSRHIVGDVRLRNSRRAEQTMGMPAAVRRVWTLAEVRALIDANPAKTPRYELVDGALLVTPSPIGPHQKAVRELLLELGLYLRQNPAGEVFDSPFDVELESETIVQPDVFVVPPDEARRLETEMPARSLILVIEVLSPASALGDRGRKRELYQRHVPEYWIVDLDARLCERWRPGDERPEILRREIDWQPAGAADSLVIELPPFFTRVTGAAG